MRILDGDYFLSKVSLALLSIFTIVFALLCLEYDKIKRKKDESIADFKSRKEKSVGELNNTYLISLIVLGASIAALGIDMYKNKNYFKIF